MKYIKLFEEKGTFIHSDYVWSKGRKRKFKPEDRTKFKVNDYVLWITDLGDKIFGKIITINLTKASNLYSLELINPNGTDYENWDFAWAREQKIRLIKPEEVKDLENALKDFEMRKDTKKYNL